MMVLPPLDISFDIRMIDRTTDSNFGKQLGSSHQMDKDWYYKWLLFSNIQQHKDWQQRLLSTQSLERQKMLATVQNYICGFCEANGVDVQQTPSTFTRLLQALDLTKLPPLLTEDVVRKRIGLCSKCESKIKLVEEATHVRVTLKETFINNLKHLSASGISNYLL